ncbi:MAG: hypothetical protein IKA41_02890 [Bacteroidaceae bacterium]|nr:hypothetical protein [Bacteroidaceae bacterium]
MEKYKVIKVPITSLEDWLNIYMGREYPLYEIYQIVPMTPRGVIIILKLKEIDNERKDIH